jgi:phosphoribosyl-AMP cyclohydrolase / phosphoribosyl-ATP pyrophosphohydrolase
MLIPSIDIADGMAVQLRQGREPVLQLGDPQPILERFAPLGEVAVIDLDAAIGQGSNRSVVEGLLGDGSEPSSAIGRLRVGGGIRSREQAVGWLDAGAARVILGTRAEPDLLRTLPRDRVMAAVDAFRGEVVTHGWRTRSGESLESRIERLRPFVGGFLVTFVETEGTLGGFDMERARRIVELAGEARVTFAGGIVDAAEIAELDAIGADAQVGMALYTGRLDPAAALWRSLVSDRPDGLVPTVVCDRSGRLLMLAYSSERSVAESLRTRSGVYDSRRRGLWRKGATSGATQRLLSIDVDCDRDALRFTVDQRGCACHTGAATCFGAQRGLVAAESTIAARLADAGVGAASYTARCVREPGLLAAKLVEEAGELASAEGSARIAEEAADLLYFMLVRLRSNGVDLARVESVLDRRALRLSRRGGDRKEVSR